MSPAMKTTKSSGDPAKLRSMSSWYPTAITLENFDQFTLFLKFFGPRFQVYKDRIINWVLSLQAHPRDTAELENGQLYGFHGSRSSQFHRHNAKGEAIQDFDGFVGI
ncbi:hypothetical protein J5N97_012842 [Dioscorea zingiberensis]|uniref:Uncharacterized protein n=1 Tax=Dioscorea zingiberensis TaxID=325984 RepID=A0A9D5CPP9_9LILI|nr:hypothetical protein J5N97_012842 [Dioscorea zingiberensis]